MGHQRLVEKRTDLNQRPRLAKYPFYYSFLRRSRKLCACGVFLARRSRIIKTKVKTVAAWLYAEGSAAVLTGRETLKTFIAPWKAKAR
jgi:hypothetical protein